MKSKRQKGTRSRKRVKKQSSPEELPHDILREILSRLPVKSLCRFKCVCKFWYNLMLDFQFVKLQVNQFIKAKRLKYVLYNYEEFPVRLELDYEALISGHVAKPLADDFVFGEKIMIDKPFPDACNRDMELWGSCDGLLCIHAAPRMIVLANPSTRETKRIFSYHGTSCLTNRFQGRNMLGGGFGYDGFNNDYKVVRINPQSGNVFVYSLKKESWSYRGKFPHHHPYAHQSLHLNGAIHWLAHGILNGSKHACIITAFDLTKEEFLNIPAPNFPDDRKHFRLDIYEGCLCLMPLCEMPTGDFWVMKKYGIKESWTRTTLNISYMLLRSLYFPKKEEALFLIDGTLVLYDCREGSSKQVNFGQFADYVGHPTNGFFYVESILSPGCRTLDKYGSGEKGKPLRNQGRKCF